MNHYFVDLHIHIGRTSSGKPVKITGSKTLTIENILYEAEYHKGMDIIGVIDCHVPEVIDTLQQLVTTGKVIQLEEGGLQFGSVTLILGVEIELKEEQGAFHVLAYVPTLEAMKELSNWLSKRMKNITLSTQRLYVPAKELQQKVRELDGIFIPAHVFTPFKSLYGVGVQRSLTEVLDPQLIDAIELGLSSNTEMADQIEELHQFTFVSNSDAHSLAKIAREYQIVEAAAPSFYELKQALHNEMGRSIIANYGLDPLLGKYHRTTCEKCFYPMEQEQECPNCGHTKKTKGVYDRLLELKNTEGNIGDRPPYIHQVPLEYMPKLGPKTLQKLKDHFGTEMNILHYVPEKELEKVISSNIVKNIVKARNGQLKLAAGGGGRYGKVSD